MTSDPRDSLGLERVVFFSDAVFAIAITLLILEVEAPHLPPDAPATALIEALGNLIPAFVGYVVSFLVIGSMWVEHHRIFRYIERYDGGLLWRNLMLLLGVAFMPFPTALYSENHTQPLALAVYALGMALVGLGKLWVWIYAARGRRLLGGSPDAPTVARITRRSCALPVTCGAVALAAGLGLTQAFYGFALIPLVAWILDRAGSSRTMKRGGRSRPVASS